MRLSSCRLVIIPALLFAATAIAAAQEARERSFPEDRSQQEREAKARKQAESNQQAAEKTFPEDRAAKQIKLSDPGQEQNLPSRRPGVRNTSDKKPQHAENGRRTSKGPTGKEVTSPEKHKSKQPKAHNRPIEGPPTPETR